MIKFFTFTSAKQRARLILPIRFVYFIEFDKFRKNLRKAKSQMESGTLLVISRVLFLLIIINFVSLQPPSLLTLKGLLVLDSHGRRVLAHYYDPECLATLQSQSAFERKLFRKTVKTNVEILIQDNLPILYK